jgi:Holliday junction resolvase RusA-like endonuclease
MPTGRCSKNGQPLFRAQIYKDVDYQAWCKAARPFFLAVAPEIPLDGPLQLSLVIIHKFRKGDQRKKHVPRRWCDAKPDWDNVGKAITDTAEDAGWIVNDSRISRVVIEKVRAAQGEAPGISIIVKKLDVPYHLR